MCDQASLVRRRGGWSTLRYLPMALHTYFCPTTGRGLEARDCRRVGRRLLSPFDEVGVQITGWPLLVIGAVLWFVGQIILTPMAPVAGNVAGLSCGIIAALRFVRQYRAFRHGQAAGR